METTIDRFGRVVIPKHVREALGLEAGESLVIEKRGEGILLRPAREGAPLKHKGRVLVFTGQVTGEPGNLVRRVREERLHKLVGRSRR
jgi:AbrB family looped-hinge helix DNA binding protein